MPEYHVIIELLVRAADPKKAVAKCDPVLRAAAEQCPPGVAFVAIEVELSQCQPEEE